MSVEQRWFPFVTVITGLVGAAVLVGCEDPVRGGDHGVDIVLEVVSGDAQFGSAGQALGQPVVLRVTEGATGDPVAGVVLDVQVLQGSGWVDRPSLTTDHDGTARLSWVLGQIPGTQRLRIEAASDRAAAAEVFAVCEGAAATALEVISGDGQRAPRGEGFPEPVRIRALGSEGQPIPGVVLDLRQYRANNVLEGGLEGSVVTDTSGVASFSWTADERGLGSHVIVYARGAPSLRVNGFVDVRLERIALTWVFHQLFQGCGLDATGEAFCWGRNTFGILGNPPLGSSNGPVPVSTDLRFRALDSFEELGVCAIDTEGDVYCWGRAGTGESFGSVEFSSVPIPIDIGRSVRAFGEPHRWWGPCWFTAGGQRRCLEGAGVVSMPVALPPGARSVAPQWPRTDDFPGVYLIGPDGRLMRSQVTGPGNTWPSPGAWSAVATELRFEELRSSARMTCGLTTDERVFCWGRSKVGFGAEEMAGNHTFEVPAAPVDLPGPVLEIATVDVGFHGLDPWACALLEDGTVHCWGVKPSSNWEHPGLAESALPARIPDLPPLTSMALSFGGICGPDSDGQVHCWNRAAGHVTIPLPGG